MVSETATTAVPATLIETVSTTSGQQEGAEPAAEPDYRALHEAATKELADLKAGTVKLEQRLRSAEGVSKQRLDIEAELGRLRRGQSVLMEYIQTTGMGWPMPPMRD